MCSGCVNDFISHYLKYSLFHSIFSEVAAVAENQQFTPYYYGFMIQLEVEFCMTDMV